MKVTNIQTLSCDAGWRNYHYVKITTDSGIVGWSEFDEGFGAPGVSAVIQRLAPRVIGHNVSQHERIYAELYCDTSGCGRRCCACDGRDRERAARREGEGFRRAGL